LVLSLTWEKTKKVVAALIVGSLALTFDGNKIK
jgi:hypothetical protein